MMAIFYAARVVLREMGTGLVWIGANVAFMWIGAGVVRQPPVVGAALGLVTGLACWGMSLKAKRYTDCPRCGGNARERGEPTNDHHYDFCSFCGGAKILRPGATEEG